MSSFSLRAFVASLMVGTNLGILSLWVNPLGCGSAQLTPEEAKQELDVACAVTVRALVGHDQEKVAAVVDEVCHAEVTAALIQRAMERFEAEHDAGADFLVDKFPADGGSR